MFLHLCKGYLIVSCQGFSEYNIYRRAPPHEYVLSFTIPSKKDNSVDRVTNTDGVTAVGTSLGPNFPFGAVVVHDDVNEGPDGAAEGEATFKIVSLGDVLGAKVLGKDLLKDVDTAWNPRS